MRSLSLQLYLPARAYPQIFLTTGMHQTRSWHFNENRHTLASSCVDSVAQKPLHEMLHSYTSRCAPFQITRGMRRAKPFSVILLRPNIVEKLRCCTEHSPRRNIGQFDANWNLCSLRLGYNFVFCRGKNLSGAV